jgi:hypothetical protein
VSGIAIYAGDSLAVDYTITLDGVAVDISTATLAWEAKYSYSDLVPVIQKTTGAGISHTNPTAGLATLRLLPADTSALATDSPVTLVWSLRLFAGDDVYTVATGLLVVEPAA